MRTGAFIVLAALALGSACRKDKRDGAPPVENRSDAAAGATRPAADAGDDACIATCIKDSQMKATSPEQIERDCQLQCAGVLPPPP